MAYTTIDDPSAHFHTQVWTGNSGYTVNVTNDAHSGNFQPDLIWAKERTEPGGYSYDHDLVDSSRGPTVSLHPNTTDAEYTRTQSNYDFTSFDSNGFTTGAPDSTASFGGSAVTNGKVAWQWKCNGGTKTSVSASGTGNLCVNASTHQVNTTAGFSIITYTGRGDQLSAGQETKLTHGLGAIPHMAIIKKTNSTNNWAVLGQNATETLTWNWSYAEYLALNTTAAVNGVTGTGNKQPDSTSIHLGHDLVNDVGDSYVCYAFTEIKGYSKFGKYIGNGNANGPFVYTGFKPAFVMIKIIDTHNGQVAHWVMYDNKRGPTLSTAAGPGNLNNKKLAASLNTVENDGAQLGGDTYGIDFLSNGFKIKLTGNNHNGSGKLYGFTAFAEHPFVTSTGVPTTAR
jgi:hypothetical protein